MRDEDMDAIMALIRATKAVVGIGEQSEGAALVTVKTSVPVMTAEGSVQTLEITAWKCAECPETHLEVRITHTTALRVLDPDTQEELHDQDA